MIFHRPDADTCQGGLRPAAPVRPGQCFGGTRCPCLAAALFGVMCCLGARADQIVVGDVNYIGATVLALEQGRLQFRAADLQPHDVGISEVNLLIIDAKDGFGDFNQAERYMAAGEPVKAVVRYHRILRLSDGFWRDLITMRLLVASDRAGRIDEATNFFVRAVQGEWSGPVEAARLMPQGIPGQRGGRVTRALSALDMAIGNELDPLRRLPLELLRYQILRGTGDPRAAEEAPLIATAEIPECLGREPVYLIQLAALEDVLNEQVEAAAMRSLDRAIAGCPRSLLASFLLVKGKTLLRTALTRDDLIRASWPLMRVAIHMPDDPRAADGLLLAAEAVERVGRPDKAIELILECLAHRHVRAGTRRQAQGALARLQAGSAAKG